MTEVQKYASFIICTSPRSGSTLLCKLLRATEVAGNPASWFHRPSIAAWLDSFNLTPDPSLAEHEILSAVFAAAIAEGTRQTGIFGLRLQAHSLEFFLQQLRQLHPDRQNDRQRFEVVFGRVLFIYLRRNDKIEQAVSYVKASQTGLWHAAPDGTELERLSPYREPYYNSVELRSRYQEMAAWDRDWEHWFAAEDILPFRLSYESLAENPLKILREILECLGLAPSYANGVTIGVAKLADRTSRDWAERLRAELDFSSLSG